MYVKVYLQISTTIYVIQTQTPQQEQTRVNLH